MKLINPVIIISWFDYVGMKQRTHLVFTGVVDRRRAQRELKRWALLNFKSRMRTSWAKAVIQANTKAFSQVIKPDMHVSNEQIEEWLNRIQDDTTDEGESDSNSQGCISETTEVHMPVMFEGFKS